MFNGARKTNNSDTSRRQGAVGVGTLVIIEDRVGSESNGGDINGDEMIVMIMMMGIMTMM